MKRSFWLLALSVSITTWSGSAVIGQTDSILRAGKTAIDHSSVSRDLDFGKIPLYFIPNRGQFDEQASFCARTSRYALWITPQGLAFDFARRSDSNWRGSEAHKQVPGVGADRVTAKYERDVSWLVFPDCESRPEVVPLEPSEHRANYFLGNDPIRWAEGVETYGAVVYRNLYPGVDLKIYGIGKEIEYDWIVHPGGDASSIRLEYRDARKAWLDQEGNLVVATRSGEIAHRKPVAYQRISGRKVEVGVRFKRMRDDVFAFEVDRYDRTRELVIDPVVLLFSTYLGGTNWDYFGGIDVDDSGCVYVVGGTFSSDFPVRSAADPRFNGLEDVFVTKFNRSGTGLIYSTFIGGPSFEEATCLTLDPDHNVYFGGFAYDGFPTKSAFDDDYDDSLHGDYYDAIIAKLDASGRLVYSTYLGKAADDYVNAIAVDSRGRACVGGVTRNADFPLKNPLLPSFRGDADLFVTIFSAAGNSLIFSTYYGGRYFESLGDIALDEHGCIYFTGYTESKDFPVKNAYDRTYNLKKDAYLVKLEPLGRSIVYSTFLGGGGKDMGSGLAVDDEGAVYVTGDTSSRDFPTKDAFDGSYNGSYDVFVTKFKTSGRNFAYSTFIGGNRADYGYKIALDSAGAAWVCGSSASSSFPVCGALDSSLDGARDGFIFKLASEGSVLAFSTFLGGSDIDRAMGIAVDPEDNVYVGGETCSNDFPVTGAFDDTFNEGDYDLFIAKIR